MESTYGGRRHRDREQTIAELGEILTSPRSRQGNILVPAFSIGRSQEILYQLGKHYDEWDLGRFRIFLDSPMAIEASKVYWEYTHLYDEEATRLRLRERRHAAAAQPDAEPSAWRSRWASTGSTPAPS